MDIAICYAYMQQLEEQLRALGLTQTEAKLYLAGLSKKAMSAQELARATKIKRPTVYHALETLIEKGLVSKTGTEARRLFQMTSPERLQHLLDQKMDQIKLQKVNLDALLPLLMQQQGAANNEQVRVMQYEGIDGIKIVVEEALYCKSRTWDIIAPPKNFFSDFDKTYSKYFIETRKSRGITARSLWEQKETVATRITPELIRERNPRYLPATLSGRFQSVMILFDDKVAIVTSLGVNSAVLIQSKEVYALMATMFEGLWAISKTPQA